MNSRTRKLLIDVIIPGILAMSIVILFPKIYNGIEQPKPVIDTLSILDTLAIMAPDDTLFSYMIDAVYEL